MVDERVRRLIPILADSALGPLRRLMVARHVAHCPDCAAELEALQSMHTVIRAKLPLHRAPPGLAARIGAALPREGLPPAPARRGFRASALAFTGTSMAGALAGVALPPRAPRGGGGGRAGGDRAHARRPERARC